MAKVYTRNNSSCWWASFKDPTGQRARRSTGIPNKDELKEKAQLKANQMELERWDNWTLGKEPVTERTFEVLAVAYLSAAQPGSGHRYNLKRLRGFFAGFVMNNLSKKDVSAYIAWRRPRNSRYPERPVSNSTMRRELGVLSVMINYANEAWEWQLPNPVMGRRPKAAQGRLRWARPEQAEKLISVAKQNVHAPWLADFIELGLNTGMRKMEMLACEWARVDLVNQCIHLYPEHQKNRRYGTVALNEAARKVLLRRRSWIAEHCAGSPWVFPSRKNRMQHMIEVKNPFKHACEAVGLHDFRPHDLRHTFASWLVQAGVSLSELKEVMRHADIKQTEQYAHLCDNIAHRVVAVLDTKAANKADVMRFERDGSAGLTHYVTQCDFSHQGHLALMRKTPDKTGG